MLAVTSKPKQPFVHLLYVSQAPSAPAHVLLNFASHCAEHDAFDPQPKLHLPRSVANVFAAGFASTQHATHASRLCFAVVASQLVAEVDAPAWLELGSSLAFGVAVHATRVAMRLVVRALTRMRWTMTALQQPVCPRGSHTHSTQKTREIERKWRCPIEDYISGQRRMI